MSTNSSFGENSPCGSKWVTFDDLIDDAMESGKLSPRRNNNSQRLFGQQQRGQRQSRSAQMTRSQTFSTSSEERLQQKQQPIVILPPPPAVEKKRRSSSVVLGSSCGSYGYNSGGGSSGASPTNFAADLGEDAPVKSPLDFSQSMGSSSEEFQGIRRTINPSGDHGCFPSTDTMLSSESETNSGGCPTPPRSSTTSATVDKYSKAFAPLRRKSKVDKSNLQGWSGKVLHGTHKLGWSDDVLGVSDLSSEDELCSSEAAAAAAAAAGSQLSTASVEEEPGWMYGGIKGQSWETSPNRRFVRNFP